ncbi:MAG TPA: peptidase [Bacteroidales bacterium]|nr:peptidase [Bacteroidales bacterium]
MKIFVKISVITIIWFIFPGNAGALNKYNDYKAMVGKAEALGREYRSLCTVKSLGKSHGGKDIIVLTIGTGEMDNKPGIAVLGGIEGSHLLGRELALGFAEYLLKSSGTSEIRKLLDKVTFYVIPDASPDGSEQFFGQPRYERNVNSRPVDDDRDFVTDEDPFEDLNNDGVITLIRVADPAGKFTMSLDDERIMVEADLSKGQTGSYHIYPEGIDNDKDGLFNEDGPGGVNFNRNLTYNYEEFGLNAGLHAVSEPESRAVLDFFFDHFNIYATFAFGPQDNLNQPARPGNDRAGGTASPSPAAIQEPAQFQGQAGARGSFPMQGQSPASGTGSTRMMMNQDRRITSVLKPDETINKLVSDKYREIAGMKGSPVTKSSPGNFTDWSYFHYGRYSFSTPAWWFPVERDKNPDVAFLKFAEENKIEDVFVPWTEMKHPDFPGKNVEVGGIKPFATINPPAEMLEDLITKNSKFIIEVAAMHPELEFLDIKTEDQGENIYRLSLKVHNKGIFATCTAAGERNLWTRIMRISLETGKNQKFLSGQKVQRIQRLEGDESAEFSWLIMGKGTVRITAGAVNTGIITKSVELK